MALISQPLRRFNHCFFSLHTIDGPFESSEVLLGVKWPCDECVLSCTGCFTVVSSVRGTTLGTLIVRANFCVADSMHDDANEWNLELE